MASVEGASLHPGRLLLDVGPEQHAARLQPGVGSARGAPGRLPPRLGGAPHRRGRGRVPAHARNGAPDQTGNAGSLHPASTRRVATPDQPAARSHHAVRHVAGQATRRTAAAPPRHRAPGRMSSDPADALPAWAPQDGGAGAELCVLLACFAGAKRAAQIRRQLDKRIGQSGDAVLDQVVLKVTAKRKALVYDPRRTLAGSLTPALTWGIFGLLAGGLQGLAVWAVLGAICGGLYAYYTEHLLTKDELKRIGGRLPSNSSAIVAFVQGTDPRRVLSSTASYQPATASVAAVTADLSAQAYSGASNPLETSTAPAGAAPTATADQAAELSMLLVRFAGEHAARQALAKSGSTRHQDQKAPQVELVIE